MPENSNALGARTKPLRSKGKSKKPRQQTKEWAHGTTPWPQAPKDGKIIYTGDER